MQIYEVWLKKKIFLLQSLRKEVASVQEGLSGAAVLSTTSSTPGSAPLTSSSTFCLPLLVIPTSGFNPSWDFRRKLRINNKSPLSAPFFSSRYIVLLISRQSGMTDVVSVNSATGDFFFFSPRPLPCSLELCIIIGMAARGTEKQTGW